MPYLLPRSFPSYEELALVTAFGTLSDLEACSLLGKRVSGFRKASDRVSVVTGASLLSAVPRLAGAHKAAPIIEAVDDRHTEPSVLVSAVAGAFDEVPTLSLSGYDVDTDDYEDLVRGLLDGLRAAGFRKTRLLRPRGNELRAEEVLSRKALDVVAFPQGNGYGLGLTAWVPDSKPVRERGVKKPAPRSEISLSPRLASLLLNLANLSPGKVVLDPFCGSGTILAEGLLRSCRCLGVDSNEPNLKEARRNLSWTATGHRGSSFHLRVGDARALTGILGETKVDAVVTEPLLLPALSARPRTETAAALLDGARGVYSEALASMADVLSPGGRIVVVVPVVLTMEGTEASITLDGRPLGLRLHQPGPVPFEYPVRLSFESTRWIRRAVYVFESRP